MANDIVITGYAETPLVLASGRSAYDLAGQVFSQLIINTNIDKDRIDGFCATASLSEGSNPFHAAHISEMLGLELNWLQIASIGGSSFLSGVNSAMNALKAGMCEVAVVLGSDAPSTSRNTLYRGYQEEFLKPTGLIKPPSAFAMLQSSYMDRYGDPSDALAKLVVQQRKYALSNPNTVKKLKREIEVEDYLNAKLIDPPLRILDSVMFVDGANAILMMKEKTAQQLGFNKAVHISSYAEASNYKIKQPNREIWSTGFELVGKKVLQEAGINQKSLQMAQLYDDFSIALLIQLEQLGFCKSGQGKDFILSTDLTAFGDLPLNTGGGQLSVGQPGLAAGGLTLIEGVRQLMQEAGGLQAKPVNNCLVTGIGGIAYACNWIMSNALVLEK